MNTLKSCPPPWCNSTKIHTTTFYKSKRDHDGNMITYTEVEHMCPSCHVRTPQLPLEQATVLWNKRK